MKLRLLSYLLLVAVAATLLTLVWLASDWRGPKKADMSQPLNRVAQVAQAAGRRQGLAAPAAHRVIAAPPVEVPAPPTPAAERYRVRNEFPEDRSQPLPLYLVDTVTGQEIRLGDDSGAAMYEQARNERYLLWWFGCDPNCPAWRDGFHAYVFATGEDILIYPYGLANVRPKLAGDWVAYPGIYQGPQEEHLLLTNLVTQETITITTELYQPLLGNNEHLGISERLVAWISSPSIESLTRITPPHLEIYDLTARTSITSIVIGESLAPTMTEYSFFSLAANETVVTWGRNYGYDIVTGSFFTFTLSTRPWTAWGGEVVYISPVAEHDRVLSWYIQTKGGSKYYLQSPLIDATPSTAPCVEGQNLVQNGDLEDIGTHNVWQQSDTASDLIVNDLPPNAPQASQWAIRLGRYSNAQPAVQQTLAIPSNVKGITLAFDVRVHSWDIWGGDQLQIDLIDPMTNQSILVTPVQWTNVQLASGGWVPLQVEIQDWPGIDTPLQLVFRAQTDWAFPTDFTVDNIRFITTCQ